MTESQASENQESPKQELEREQESLPLEEMVKLLEAQPDPEAKLALAVLFLEKAISQSGSPQFRTFWELRKQCQALFRENLSPGIRAKLWARFTELSEEGRRLKEVIDEQSAFAAEQIEVAIKALESDLDQWAQLVERSPIESLPSGSRTLEGHCETYQLLQRELGLLNAYATRVNVLRKELIKTDMRIGQKNRLFQRLSSVGDRIFPRRKELIQDVSQRFTNTVNSFLESFEELRGRPQGLRGLREEIQALQMVAKGLSLDTKTFNKTRHSLSACWEKMKEVEKVQRQERAKEKAVFREKAQEMATKIQEFSEKFQGGEVPLDAAKQQIDQLSSGIRSLMLARDELNTLQDGLRQARQLVVDKVRAAEQERYQREAEREKQRREVVDGLSHRILRLVSDNGGMSSAQMTEESNVIQKEVASAKLTRDEKIALERELRPVRDLIIERREKELLALPADDQQALDQLYKVLEERQGRRVEIRKQLESLRKAGAASGRDFEQALLLNAQVAEEKARLERIEEGIQELEEQIDHLEERI